MRVDARANRQAIVRSARTRIAAQGLDISLTAVAGDAGVGIATFYRHFPTREHLVRAVLEDMEASVLGIIDDASGRMASDPERAWPDFVHAIADLRMGALIAAFSAQFVTDDRIPDTLMSERAQTLAAIQQVLDAAIRAGLVRRDLTAVQFQTGIALLTRPLPDVAMPDDRGRRAWLIEDYIHGLGPRDTLDR